MDRLVMLLEFIIAVASIGNVADLAWTLGAKAIFLLLPNQQYTVALWAFLGFTIHIFGAVALRLRTKVALKQQAEGATEHYSHTLDLLKNQFKPQVRKEMVRVTILPESWIFFLAAWLTAIFTTCHIIFGTILFSSILFCSVNDALIILGWLMGSVIACRVILTYELAILQKAVRVEDAEKA
jgi:hypothetical protein